MLVDADFKLKGLVTDHQFQNLLKRQNQIHRSKMRKRRTERKNNILDTQTGDEMLFESTPLPAQRNSPTNSFVTSPSLRSTNKNTMIPRSKSSVDSPYRADGHDEDDKDVNV